MIANGAGDEDFLAYVKTMETLSGMKAKDYRSISQASGLRASHSRLAVCCS